jgi:hypothetical protein
LPAIVTAPKGHWRRRAGHRGPDLRRPGWHAPGTALHRHRRRAHYRSPNTVASDFRSFAFTVALVTFVWFVVALSTLLRRAEDEAPWRSSIAMVSGVLFVALVLSGNEIAAAFRADDLDPQIARYAFDEGQAAFANARVALGSFAVCCGWVIASTRFLPRWVGWLAIASGVGLALSRISWTSYIWLLPNLMFWLWVITVAVLLLRRNFRGVAQSG